MAKHIYEILIREHHLDTYGHMNNATYFQIFEEARWQLITDGGYGLERILETKIGPIVLAAEIKFQREIPLRTLIRIETELVEYRSRTGKVQQQMIDSSSGEVCCTAKFTIGLFDQKSRKLLKPSDDWLKAIQFTNQ